MNGATTIKTSPAKILAKLRAVNQKIQRVTMQKNIDRALVKELQAESDRLNRELAAANTWINGRVLQGKPTRAQ